MPDLSSPPGGSTTEAPRRSDDPPPLVPAVPDEVVGALRSSGSAAVIVDLDETLWLRNTTEEYLNSIRPRWLVAVVLIACRAIPVWRVFGHHDDAEEWFRVVVCSILFPWALPAWRWRARRDGPRHLNRPLADLLVDDGHTGLLVIATRGFDPVVAPVIDSFGIDHDVVVACRFWRGRDDRRRGKAEMLCDVLGDDVVRDSTVITDSELDRPLLDIVRLPVLVTWEQAIYTPAPTIYAPFAYTELYKRRGQRYVFHMVLARDLLLWLVATTTVARATPVAHVGGMVLLLVSFWCVYESGYLQNDRVASRYEESPVLPDADLPGRRYDVGAWVWAVVLGAAGAVLVRPDEPIIAMVSWGGVLVGLSIGYLVYNHLDKQTRTVLYVGLQAARLLAPLAIVPVASAGLVALLVLSWSRSMLYAFYRSARTTWIEVPHGLIDLAQLAIAYLVLWRVHLAIEVPVAAGMLVLFALFARGEARAMLRGMHLIRRDRRASP